MLEKTGGPATAIALLKEFAWCGDASRAPVCGHGSRWGDLEITTATAGCTGKASVVREQALHALCAAILKEEGAYRPGRTRGCRHFAVLASKWRVVGF